MRRQVIQGPLDLLLPTFCVGCRRPAPAWFCDECATNADYVRPPFCLRCGAPIRTEEQLCADCPSHPLPDSLVEIRSVALYRGTLGRAIRSLKYGRAAEIAETLGAMLADYLSANPLSDPLVIPVPLHPEKLRERGFNQSELMARAVGQRFGWDVDPSALRRERRTHAQVALDAEARRLNVRGAFHAPLRLDGREVLLVDDVRTTGATLSECAAALHAAGAGPIRALTLALERRT